ncbi:hypothetical protein NUU61_000102 [Penicillium alfredii]|uniref:LysM domain-containing protein n=1 Tax=Penicillium alfredii TaxID=1506179 RepID=A0A9W9KQR3_9EURO|nr:uncharacterized protein NUU61_000102 [Penicillium alfredii]KAJ5114343.1 hypothetical protein NUU61_000102 [Penicillium alfredii]
MFLTPLFLAAGSLPALISGAPVSNSQGNNLLARAYQVFAGTGSAADGWATLKQWKSFDLLWIANSQNIGKCDASWGVEDNTPEETSDMKEAIEEVTKDSPFKGYPEFIFAIMMQETKGCVRVKTTVAPDGSVSNPGLMQSHNGKFNCYENGKGVKPCKKERIVGMIRDGVTGSGGLSDALQENGGKIDAETLYKVARTYNSGSVAPSKNLGDGQGATACYATDIANRLTDKWSNGPSGCDPNTIGTMNKSEGGGASGGDAGDAGDDASSSSSDTGAAPTGAPTASNSAPAWGANTQSTLAAAATTAPAVNTPPAGNTNVGAPSPTVNAGSFQQTSAAVNNAAATNTPAPSNPVVSSVAPANTVSSAPPTQASGTTEGSQIYPSSLPGCQQRYPVVDNDYCYKVQQQFGMTLDDLRRLNPGLDERCSNLWKGYQYCVRG